MQPRKRRIIAYIVGRIASGKPVNYLYDYSTNNQFAMSGQVDLNQANIFDYESSNYVVGNGNGGVFNLFDYSTGSYIQLRYTGGSFSGFDYASGANFSGNATATGNVTLFDYGTGQYYHYQV